jgi:hypothetical protein
MMPITHHQPTHLHPLPHHMMDMMMPQPQLYHLHHQYQAGPIHHSPQYMMENNPINASSTSQSGNDSHQQGQLWLRGMTSTQLLYLYLNFIFHVIKATCTVKTNTAFKHRQNAHER